MRRHTACVVLALVALTAIAPIGAAAQPDGPQPTAAANSTNSGERIDSDLRLVSSSYDGESHVTLTFETDASKAVTLSDAGGFIDGGRIHRETMVLDGGGEHTVTFRVTESSRGYVGVSIATQDVLYAEVVQSPSPSPFKDASGTTGWLGGASIALLSFVGAAFYKLRGEAGEPVEASP